MKKLFASLVAVLAIAPVVANAASGYKPGDYVNFAGNDADWSAFKSGDESYLLKTGAGTIYLEDTELVDSNNNPYLRVAALINKREVGVTDSTTGSAIDRIKASDLYTGLRDAIRADIVPEYGYAQDGTNVDVDVASFADLKVIYGVEQTVGSQVNIDSLDEKKLALFDNLEYTTIYVLSSTPVTGQDDQVWGLKVTLTADPEGGYKASAAEVANINIVTPTRVNGTAYTFVPVINMNSAYVCTKGTVETYACYECPTTGDQTELVWKKEGSQDAACKVVENVTDKSKCAKNVKTGVDSYLIPSAIVLGVCAIVLTVLKRKDAFKTI